MMRSKEIANLQIGDVCTADGELYKECTLQKSQTKGKKQRRFYLTNSKVVKAQEDSGNMDGGYGLRAQVAGNNSYYSHYAFVGASSIKSAMEGQQQLYSSDAFAEFSKAVAGNRKLIQTSTVVVLATYE